MIREQLVRLLLRSSRRLKKQLVLDLVRDHFGETVLLQDCPKKGECLALKLGPCLGQGYFGGVYLIQCVPQELGLSTEYNGPCVIKIPHSLKRTGLPHPLQIGGESTRREWETYRLLLRCIMEIESSPHFPRHPNWKRSSLPVIPILGTFGSDLGTVLIKPKIRFTHLSELPRSTKPSTQSLRADLKAIYDLAQAIHDRVLITPKPLERFLSPSHSVGFALDIRQENLFWTGDPDTMTLLSLTRSGLALFETDQLFLNWPLFQIPNHSFESYLEDFHAYTRANF